MCPDRASLLVLSGFGDFERFPSLEHRLVRSPNYRIGKSQNANPDGDNYDVIRFSAVMTFEDLSMSLNRSLFVDVLGPKELISKWLEPVVDLVILVYRALCLAAVRQKTDSR